MELPDETRLKIAAAAAAGAVSPPLGAAVAAGAALGSPRVRRVLRNAAVQALGTAMKASDEVVRKTTSTRTSNGHSNASFAKDAEEQGG